MRIKLYRLYETEIFERLKIPCHGESDERALVYDDNGSPDNLELRELKIPAIKEDEKRHT